MNESFVTWRRNARWEDAERLYGAFGAEDGRMRSVCAEETEQRMGGIGSFVLCHLRKVYRLSGNTL